MPEISISRGCTINLGKYESARVDVSIVEQFTFTPSEDKGESDTGFAIALLDRRVKNYLALAVDEIESSAGLPPLGAKRFIGANPDQTKDK